MNGAGINDNVGKTLFPYENPNTKLRYDVKNLQNVGARAGQEDSFTIVNGINPEQYDQFGMLLAVCDGMGGMKGGKDASTTAVNTLRGFFSVMDRNGDISGQLRNTLVQASGNIYNTLGGEGGSTAVVCIILNEQLYFASVGDSFLWLYRNGKLIRLNQEHNIRNELLLESIRNERFEPFAADSSNEPNALTSFLGMPELTDIDGSCVPMRLRRGDTLVLCSDGVGGTLTDAEVIDALVYPQSAACCDILNRHIITHAKPNQDNYTAIVLKCI